jgi:hypothetical protein
MAMMVEVVRLSARAFCNRSPYLSCELGREPADSRQQTADSRQQTEQTADSRQQTANSRHQTADSRQYSAEVAPPVAAPPPSPASWAESSCGTRAQSRGSQADWEDTEGIDDCDVGHGTAACRSGKRQQGGTARGALETARASLGYLGTIDKRQQTADSKQERAESRQYLAWPVAGLDRAAERPETT